VGGFVFYLIGLDVLHSKVRKEMNSFGNKNSLSFAKPGRRVSSLAEDVTIAKEKRVSSSKQSTVTAAVKNIPIKSKPGTWKFQRLFSKISGKSATSYTLALLKQKRLSEEQKTQFRRMYQKWCPQPYSRDLESPKIVVATSKEYTRQSPPKGSATKKNGDAFHYSNMDYAGFYGQSVIDELLSPPKDNHPYIINATNVTMERVSQPMIHKAAVCRVNPRFTSKLQHFAHAMEEFYKCFDYWIESGAGKTSNNGDTKITPVLLYDNVTQGNFLNKSFQKNTFMIGIKEFLTSEIDLTILKTDDYYKCHFHQSNDRNSTADAMQRLEELCKTLYHPDQTIRTYSHLGENGYWFRHSKEWNEYMESYLKRQHLEDHSQKDNSKSSFWGKINNLQNNQKPIKARRRLLAVSSSSHQEMLSASNSIAAKPKQSTTEDMDIACAPPPRIGILNRVKTRTILNAQDIAKDLSDLIYVFENTLAGTNPTESRNFTVSHPVQVTYFEKKSFVEQVEYFRNIDILITGHGAALTGLPFMANDTKNGKSCKQVLELYGKGYGLPYYFGSLAVQSGLGHSYVYYDDGMGDIPHQHEEGSAPKAVAPPKTPNRGPLVDLKPWGRANAKEYKDRVAARKFRFCPQRDDMVQYVSNLVAEWYKCHGC